jgi:hypothetical protein
MGSVTSKVFTDGVTDGALRTVRYVVIVIHCSEKCFNACFTRYRFVDESFTFQVISKSA